MRSIVIVLGCSTLLAAASIQQTIGNRTEGPFSSTHSVTARRAISGRGLIEGKNRETALRFEIMGRLTAIEVAEGEQVRAGETLAQMESAAWDHELTKAQASFTSALAEKERLINGVRKETRDYTHAQARIAQARTNQVRKRLQRVVHLVERSAVAQQELDDLESNFEMAQSELDAALARASEAEAPARIDEVRIADAKIAFEEARLRDAQTTLQKSRLVAPCDGIVLRVRGEPGELVGPEAPEPIIIMVDNSETRIRVSIEEMDALSVSVGQRAYAVADGLPSTRFWGTVTSCAPSMQFKRLLSNAPGERLDVKVREVIIVLDPQDRLIVGLPVDVLFEDNVSSSAEDSTGSH